MLGHPVSRALSIALAVALSASALGPQDGETLTVTKKSTRMRNAKRLYGPAVAELKEGDRLILIERDAPWCRVRFQGAEGWIHETDVSPKTDVRLSGQGVRENYTVAETAAAKKGFNKEVEKTYQDEHPDLKPAFQKVDRVEARAVPENVLVSFLRAGGLLNEEGR